MKFSRTKSLFFILGLVAVMSQVIILRRLFSIFHGNELTLAAALAGWMLWTAAASYVSGNLSDRVRQPLIWFNVTLLLISVFLLLTVALAPGMNKIFHYSPGEMVGIDIILLGSLLLTGPVCILLGLAFNLACQVAADPAHAVARVYLYDALGAGLGGLFFSLVLAGHTSLWTQTLIVFLCCFIGSLIIRSSTRLLILSILLLLVSGSVLLLPGHGLIKWSESWPWRGQEVVGHRDSRYGNLAAVRSAEQVTIYVDGSPAFAFPDPQTAEPVAHLALSMVAKPARVLLIGGGLASVAEQALKHPVARLDYVQIDPDLTEMEAKYIPATAAMLSDHRISVHHEDGYRFVRQATDKAYDAVILNVGLPETVSINRFYTVEFMSELRRIIAPRGVLCLSAGAAANYYSAAQTELLAVILQAVEFSFRRVVALPLGNNFIVAGDDDSLVTDDPEKIDQTLKARGVQTRFIRLEYLKAELAPDRLEILRSIKNRPGLSKLNHDLKPQGYLLGMRIWADQVSPQLSHWLRAAEDFPASYLLIALLILTVLALLILLMTKVKNAAVILAVGLMGYIGMTAEVTMIIAFQIVQGYIYQWLGLLVTAFMIGLSTGAALWEAMRGKNFCMKIPESRSLAGLFALLGGLSIIGLILIRGLVERHPSGPVSIAVICAYLLVTALVCGVIYPLAAEILRAENIAVGFAASRTNAADYIGAAISALVAAGLIIPLFGIGEAFVLSAALSAAAMILTIAIR